ncbi:MAG: transcriptional regulator NrdR [Gemmatimonadota bacterium]
MRCPECDSTEDRVVDSRSTREGRAVRRRRECAECGARFTTYEYVEERPIQVLKQAGDAEDFDREKLRRSIQLASAKRPVSPKDIEAIVDDVEDTLSGEAGVEVPSERIGEMVMEHLKPLDRVAYVRFASVYKNFQTVDEFQDFVHEMTLRERREREARDQVELQLPAD